MPGKTKSMRGSDGGRKLAAGSGRTKQKSGGEAKQDTGRERGSSRRTGSGKQPKA